MAHYPSSIVTTNHTAPAPRRVRGIVDGRVVFDTTSALYVWEWPQYPQYYLPQSDVDMELVTATGLPHDVPQGRVQRYDLTIDATTRRNAARLVLDSPFDGLAGRMRFDWESLDRWFEEDEEVFVHPRNPYARVDALRSRRHVRVELAGTLLAESVACVHVFETGLPTRYYFDQNDVRFEHLLASRRRTACPYKGRTTGYWSVVVDGATHEDVAWSYGFPTRQLLPIAGLVAFLNEKVDISIDGVRLERPQTHMS